MSKSIGVSEGLGFQEELRPCSSELTHVGDEATSSVNSVLDKTNVIQSGRALLREMVGETPLQVDFETAKRYDIPRIGKLSRESEYTQIPHLQARGLEVMYPASVVGALGLLYEEYCQTFRGLIESHKLSGEAYRYCFDANGNPQIPFIQIDMMYLPQAFVDSIRDEEPKVVAEILRPFIFEFESSLAYYNLLSKINTPESSKGDEVGFAEGFRENLDRIREQSGKKVILLAVTGTKKESILREEFGIGADENYSEEQIRELSGFDSLWGPDELQRYFDELPEGEESQYVFFTRASIDVSELRGKKGQEDIDINVLADERLRSFVQEFTLTANIDGPNSVSPINDTKAYMEKLGMGVFVDGYDDVVSQEARTYISQSSNGLEGFEGPYYTPKIEAYLQSLGFSPKEIHEGSIVLRLKPVFESYGAYGHTCIDMHAGARKRKSTMRTLSQARSGQQFVVQAELPAQKIKKTSTDGVYRGIHRIFMKRDPETGEISFMEGFINIIPEESEEARKNNVHGNNKAQFGFVGKK